MSKNTALAFIVWLALAAGMLYIVNDMLNPNKADRLGELRTVTLQRGLDGHYRAEAYINGNKVNVLVDTGATGVAISSKLAEELGLESRTAIRTTTANGDSTAYMARLDSVKLGGVEAQDVAAIIAPGLRDDVLLGMSFLSRMDVRLYKSTMTITQVE